MKYIFVSDIHGSVDTLETVLTIFREENADKLVILGDTASFTDANANDIIATTLNNMIRKVEVIRGNCDTLSFEEKILFEMYDYDNLYIANKFVTITHGHLYNYNNLPSSCGDIFIQGHTHIPLLIKQENRILANPGSISRPRGSNIKCYIMIDDNGIYLKTVNGKVVKRLEFVK